MVADHARAGRQERSRMFAENLQKVTLYLNREIERSVGSAPTIENKCDAVTAPGYGPRQAGIQGKLGEGGRFSRTTGPWPLSLYGGNHTMSDK